MRKNYTILLNHSRLLSAAIVLLSVTSCFDDTLDVMNKDVSNEAQIFRDGLSVPIGSTLPIYLSEYLDFDADGLDVSTDGLITITQTGDPIEEEVAAISPIDLNLGDFDPSDITVNISTVEIDPIKLPIENVEQKTNLPEIDVEFGEPVTVSDKTDFEADLESSLGSYDVSGGGYEITKDDAISLEIGGDSGYAENNVDFSNKSTTDGSYPELTSEVESLTKIKFADKSATITIDASDVASCFSGFNIYYPEIEIVFPVEFELSNNNLGTVSSDANGTYLTIADYQGDENALDITFKVVSYNKTFTDEIQIEGAVDVKIKNPNIWGTYTGANSDYKRDVNVDIDILCEVEDAELTTGEIETSVVMDDSDSAGDVYSLMNDPIEITGLPESVDEITYVGFDSTGNTLTISVDAIDWDPLTLSGEDIVINFDTNLVFTGDTKSHLNTSTNELTIPAADFINKSGYSNTLTLSKLMLEDADFSDPNSDGEKILTQDLAITMSNELTFIVTESTAITLAGYDALNDTNPYYVVIKIDSGENGLVVDKNNTEIKTSAEYVDIDGDSQTINISEALDTGDVKIERLYKGSLDPEEDTYLVFDITLNDVATNIGEMTFYNFEVEVPNFIQFDSAALATGLIETKEGQQIINLDGQLFTKSGTQRLYSKSFKVEAFDFSDDEYKDIIDDSSEESILSIDDEISYTGQVMIAAGEYDLNQSTITGEVNFSMGDKESDGYYVTITSVDADIEMALDVDPTTVDLSDLNDSFGDNSTVSLVLSDPALKLFIKNPSSFNLEVSSFEIKLLDESGAEFGNAVTITPGSEFIIPANTGDDDYTMYGVWLSASGEVPSSVDFTYDGETADETFGVKVDYLGDIFKDGIPSELEISITVEVADPTSAEYYTIELDDEESEISIAYEMVLPLAVSDVEIDMTTDIDDLGDSIGELTEYTNAITLFITAESTIPLDLTIYDVTLYDVDGNVLQVDNVLGDSGKAIIAAATVKSDKSTEMVESKIELSLNGGDDNVLSSLEKMTLSIFAANDAESEIELYGTQSLKMILSASLPEGLTVDLSDLEGDDDDDENND